MFGSPKDGIRLPEFKVHMKKMGLVLSDKDAEELFYTIDDNGTVQAHTMHAPQPKLSMMVVLTQRPGNLLFSQRPGTLTFVN